MEHNYKLSPNCGGSYHSKKQIKEASIIKQDQTINGNQLFDLCRVTFNKNNGFFIKKNGRKFLIKIDEIIEVD